MSQTDHVNESSNLTPLQMRRKVALMQRGKTGAGIGRQIGVSKAAVSQVMLDRLRSRRIEDAIAQAVGEQVEELFPYRTERVG